MWISGYRRWYRSFDSYSKASLVSYSFHMFYWDMVSVEKQRLFVWFFSTLSFFSLRRIRTKPRYRLYGGLVRMRRRLSFLCIWDLYLLIYICVFEYLRFIFGSPFLFFAEIVFVLGFPFSFVLLIIFFLALSLLGHRMKHSIWSGNVSGLPGSDVNVWFHMLYLTNRDQRITTESVPFIFTREIP